MTNSVKKLIVSNRRYSEIQAHTSLKAVLVAVSDDCANVRDGLPGHDVGASRGDVQATVGLLDASLP